MKRLPRLSEKELTVLRLQAQGKSRKETAALLQNSVRTIESNMDAIKAKLGCENLVQVGVLVERLGLLREPAERPPGGEYALLEQITLALKNIIEEYKNY